MVSRLDCLSEVRLSRLRLMNLPVYASSELFGSTALLDCACLSFPLATLGFGWLVRPLHLVLSF